MDNTIYSMTQYDIRYTTSDYDVMKTPPRGIANRKKDLPGDKMSGVQVSGDVHRYPVWQGSWQTAERLTWKDESNNTSDDDDDIFYLKNRTDNK